MHVCTYCCLTATGSFDVGIGRTVDVAVAAGRKCSMLANCLPMTASGGIDWSDTSPSADLNLFSEGCAQGVPIEGAVVTDKTSSSSSHGRLRLSRQKAELGFHTKPSLFRSSTRCVDNFFFL